MSNYKKVVYENLYDGSNIPAERVTEVSVKHGSRGEADRDVDMSTSNTETSGNSTTDVTLFSSPDSSYKVIKDALENATSSVYIEMYSVSNRYLIDIVSNLSNKEIEVKAILQKNHASGFENDYTLGAAHSWYTNGTSVYWASSQFRFTHSKFVIIDNQTIIIESANWVKTGVPVDPSYGNREWGVVVHNNTQLASNFLDVFKRDLNNGTMYNISDGEGELTSYNVYKGPYHNPFSAKRLSISSNSFTSIFSPENSSDEICNLLSSANDSIMVEQMYIYKDWDGELSPFVDILTQKSQNGTKIEVIMNRYKDTINEHSNETAQYLLEYNVSVAWSNYDFFKAMHNKGVIVDRKHVLVSSINWNYNSVHKNREAGIIISNEDAAQYFERIFKRDWNESEKIDIMDKHVFSDVLINEFESNPLGQDKGNEWVELYNPTDISIDIGGGKLSTTGGKTVNVTIRNGTIIEADGYWIYVHGKQWLDNTNESVILFDGKGNEIDRTPKFDDEDNNNYTWSRYPNGDDTNSTKDWKFQVSTKNMSNGGENKPPTGKIDEIKPNPANESETVYFYGNGTDDGTIEEYCWNSGIDDFLSSEKSFSLSNLSNGTHTIYFKVKDNNDTWSKEVNTTLTINGIPRANIDEIQPNPAIKNEKIEFLGHGTDDGNITRYLWRSNIHGELHNGTEPEFLCSNLSLGTHTITLKVQDNYDVWSEEVSTTLIVHEKPVANITSISPNPALDNEVVYFVGSGTDDGQVVRYYWTSSLDDELYNGTNSSFSTSDLSVGTHTITLKVQDNYDAWSDEV
ncbi:MAG: lamin tail domain-containing protein, partial [Thermoplasmata archaeon]|nr:lamin tail domain-containing protein [Thermoplasmata archaeon]